MNIHHRALALTPGVEVLAEGRRGFVVSTTDLDTLLVRDKETGQARSVALKDIEPCFASRVEVSPLEGVSDAKLQVAQQRLEHIQPLIEIPARTRKMVEARALEVGVHTNTLYHWIKLYEGSRLLTALVPQGRNDKGATRLTPEVEAVIADVIDKQYLQKQRKSVRTVYRDIKTRCTVDGLSPPHISTVHARIASLSGELKVARRNGRKAAEEKYSLVEGHFPGADWPLAVVEVDHTKLDIILVDECQRRPVGRPWITLAIDVFSRMVLGFHVSFDPPGAASTGLCLAHAVLPKEAWLAKKGVEGEWPCWGLPKTLHLDNAREFRGTMLERACKQYGIDIEWRPVARPHFGGHIERLLGTLAKEVHTLPGTTFSNTRQRGEYDSEGAAVFTLSEFEHWLATYVVQVYHVRLHTSLKMPPIAKFKEGILGTTSCPGVGLPARILDEDRLKLDFMPFENRTVQDYGVVIDNVHYWHDVLRRWINAADPLKPKVKREFLFRRDPRDISSIWFFDPEVQTYYPIPYRDTSHPAISVWELREAKRRLEDEGARAVDERAVFTAYERMREIEELAKDRTKAARRSKQRRSMGIGAMEREVARPSKPLPMPGDGGVAPSDIQPFDEMDDLST